MTNSTSPNLFVGFVSRSDPATHLIHVDPHAESSAGGTGLMQGLPLISVFSTTLGFKESMVYPVGSAVLCMDMTGGQCYILGLLPDFDLGDTSYWSRACLGTEDTNSQDAPCNTLGYRTDSTNLTLANNFRPTDVVEGEYVLSNELGVLLGLFQELAVLKGSELAQIQCFLLDDLVRLISHNFSHWTAAGELNVWHDGKAIMIEQGMTHLSRESLGIPQTTDKEEPVFTKEDGSPKVDDSSDYYKFTASERGKAIERLKLFAGRLGDLIHIFLTRPDDKAKRSLDGEQGGDFDRGLFDIHLGTDGRLSVRTATALSLEKTNWIRVPLRVRNPEDPKGDEADDIEFEDKEPFEWDDSVKVRENPVGYFLQLRDCLAYTQDKYAYLNFDKYKKDIKFSKSPTDQEKKLSECEDIDPDTKHKFGNYKLRRSGLYFMDNGGMMLKDAWGSAIVMEGGNIYLQPVNDLIEQPLRHTINKSGHSYQVAAKKHIDFSSTEEGMRLKTKRVQHFYSQEAGIILQSDASSTVPPLPADTAYDVFGGILLLAKDAGVFTYGNKIFDDAKENSMYKANNQMIFESETSDIWMIPQKNFYIFPEGDILATTQGSITVLGGGSALFAGGGSTAIGTKDQIIGMVPHPGSLPAILDGVIPTSEVIDTIVTIRTTLDDLIQKMMFPFDEESKFLDVKFRFLKSDRYSLSDKQDFIPMTIGQQDQVSFGFLELEGWSEQEIEATLPFPGKEKFDKYYLTTEALKNVKISSEDKEYESNSYDDINSTGVKLVFGDLNNYKVKN
jgi:hypothetical protein